jgi:hypothetical protein
MKSDLSAAALSFNLKSPYLEETAMPAAPKSFRLEALRSAPLDSWIALSEDETKIVAVGSTYDEAVKNSERAGVSEPILVKTPKSWLPFSV